MFYFLYTIWQSDNLEGVYIIKERACAKEKRREQSPDVFVCLLTECLELCA